ncbi:MAG: family 1 encapsulin nanocompartment shell protein [Fervidobacterium sp.]
MEFLKRAFAPITTKSWKEIDERTKEILKNNLYARRVVDVHGPLGWQFSALPLGEVEVKSDDTDKVQWGIRKILPVIELRTSFKLKIWDLDNIERGAQAPDFSTLEDAARQVAKFEDELVFFGCPEYGIKGIVEIIKERSLSAIKDDVKFLSSVQRAIQILKKDGISGPYNLLISADVWKEMVSDQYFYQTSRVLLNLLEGGKVVPTPRLDEAIVIAQGNHFKLFIGQDFSVGYEGSTDTEVKLFITETLTFCIVNPLGAVGLKF